MFMCALTMLQIFVRGLSFNRPAYQNGVFSSGANKPLNIFLIRKFKVVSQRQGSTVLLRARGK